MPSCVLLRWPGPVRTRLRGTRSTHLLSPAGHGMWGSPACPAAPPAVLALGHMNPPARQARGVGRAGGAGGSAACRAAAGGGDVAGNAEHGPYRLPEETRNFLTPEECAHLIELARPNLEASKTSSDSSWGGSVNAASRTSSSALLEHAALTPDPILRAVGEKAAKLCGIPVENQELIQVVRYLPGQEFKPHFDSGGMEFSSLWLGFRVCTVFLYLNEGFEGGTTSFQALGTSVEPEEGKALLFWNLDPISGGGGAKAHPLSLHSGDPLESGEKWAVNIWVRERAYVASQGTKYAAVAAYLAVWVIGITAYAFVARPAWLMPSF